MIGRLKPFFLILFLILIVLCLKEDSGHINNSSSITGITIINETITKKESVPKISMIYYYNPNCPFCRAVNPYIEYLKNFFDVEFCNIKNVSNCSRDALIYMALIMNKTGGFGVPTLVIKKKNVVFQGFDSIVLGLEKYIEKEYNYTIEIFVGEKYYKPSQCYLCHIDRKIKPPSKFSCSNCCHFAKK